MEDKRILLSRLQEYPGFEKEAFFAEFGNPGLTLADLARLRSFSPKAGSHAREKRLNRVKWFVTNPKKWEPVFLSNGVDNGPTLSNREPFVYDGRHRLVAAMLRGDERITARFRWYGLECKLWLPIPVIHYLTGQSNVRPTA